MELAFGGIALALAIYCVIALLCGKQFAQGLSNISEKEYPAKKLMPIGLLILKLASGGADGLEKVLVSTDVRRKLIRLYGERGLRFNTVVYAADVLTYLLLLTFTGCFLTAATGEIALFVLTLILEGAVVLVLLPKRLDENMTVRQRAISMEFPDFLSKFILLLGAGLTVQEAWNAAIQSQTSNTPLYRELADTNRDMQELGKPVGEALMNFSIRSHSAEIGRFVSTVVQFVEYGGGDLSATLAQQSSESWRNRRQEALRLGQEAETKLTGTMILMFLAIIAIVMAPAIMSMKSVF